jgi:hypothetical protein
MGNDGTYAFDKVSAGFPSRFELFFCFIKSAGKVQSKLLSPFFPPYILEFYILIFDLNMLPSAGRPAMSKRSESNGFGF